MLTAIGTDRPGLVSRVSKLLHALGANIEDSRMAVLGGEFALMLLVSGSAATMAETDARTRALARELGLEVGWRDTAEARSGREVMHYRLQVTGLDHPGIVQTVSTALAEQQVNVAAMDTRIVYAPLSGTPTFQLRADLEIPTGVKLSGLREALAQACEPDNLDFVLEAQA